MIEVSLADVTRLITDGKHGDCVDECNSGYYFISCKDVRDGKIHYDDARQITRADYEDTHRRTRLEPNDILITNSGTIGRMALVQEAELTRRTTFQKSVAIVKPNRNVIEPKFLYYTLQAQVSYFVEISGGTAQKNLLLGDLRRFKLMVPHIDDQRKIAAILSAYDDLIENNQRRIALLEKMAGEIYREWFVRMRFPGHEKVKIIKGVPTDWEQKNLPQIANITYGYAFDGSRFNIEGRGKPIIRIRNISESLTTDYTDEIANDKYIIRHGDLLVGMDGEFHINHWRGDDAYLVQRVCRIEAKDPMLNGYLAHAIRAPIKHFESILMGATVGHLGAMHLKSITLLVPPEYLQKRLHVLNDIHRQILRVSKTSRVLSRTRDMLLPRLISGKLSVEQLDIQFPPGMEESASV